MKNMFCFFARLFCVVFICVNFLSCASSAFVVSNPVQVPKDFFGITPDQSPLNKEDFELLDSFNAEWIRSTIRWSDVEKEEGTWKFDHWDAFIAKTEAAGKKVVLVIGFDNPWLYNDNKEHRAFTERELPYFLKYVEQVASRYRTRIVYEIWNEPNWVFWYGTDKQFFPVSAAAAKKIREVEPNAIILAGSTSRVDKSFTRGMFKTGAMVFTDGFALHPYATSPLGTVRQIDKLQKILDEFNYDKPIWITEVGYSTGPISFCAPKKYPTYIVKTLSGLATRADKVRNLIWFELMDNYNPKDKEIPNPLHPINYFGLTYPNGNYKLGAEAFMLSASFLAGAEHNPNHPLRQNLSNNITSLYFVKNDGTNILILWNNGVGKKKINLVVPNANDVIRHDINNREVFSLTTQASLKVGREPVFITWKGGGSPRLTKKQKQ